MDRIIVPTLIIDTDKCKQNIRRMKKKADESGVLFRPHFKTHHSAAIGEWFRDEGIETITVSSVNMALYFAAHGWKNITIAIPLNIREIEKLNELASRISINILIESTDTAVFVSNNITQSLGYFIEIDTGYHRTGVNPKDVSTIHEIILICSHNSRIDFKGFLAHAGESYNAGNRDEILNVYDEGIRNLQILYKQFVGNFPEIIISWGDTPTCSLVNKFENIHEIRPGNFVFYDVMQFMLGSCKLDHIAVVVACPVIARYPARNQVVIYGGAVHLSKEYITYEGNMIYGLVAFQDEMPWKKPLEATWISSLTQEHGIITSFNHEFLKQVNIGDVLLVFPVHSCLTADIMRFYKTTESKIIHCMDKF